ncbi:hypothetical protein ACFE04_015057 [Oxalis oulophora]
MLQMEEAFRIGEQVSNGEEQHTDILSEIDNRRKKEFVAPAIGMEFETYEDAYNYYSCYAKEVGFRVRVKNSWFKRNSREKYGAVLCCSSQGFKRIKDVNRLRQETRTGCPAMLRMRIGESKRWRILDVTHEHNHSLGVKIKSTKKLCSGTKRKLQKNSSSEVQKIKLYQALVIDTETNNNTNPYAKEVRNNSYHLNQLNLKKGDTQAITTQLHVDGPIVIFLVKERVMTDRREIRDYERFYVPDQRSTNNGGNDVAGVQWFNQLYRSALQVVEEGVVSLDHYKAALQAFDESLNRVHDVDEKQEQIA